MRILCITAALAVSGPLYGQDMPVSEMSVDGFIDALSPKAQGLTRGLSVQPAEAAEDAPAPSIDLAVEFDFGSPRLTSEAQALLSNLAQALQSRALAEHSFQMSGHTDAVGSDEVNDRLSLERARSVRDFLVEVHGIAPDRLSVLGFGKRKLLFPDRPEDAGNRRVEISLMP
ncbi:MAG: OmpA family protein [Rhodobacteraceae bacterium]|nr:MAG: OmpA family protein [Paracoccaceae bacterium]